MHNLTSHSIIQSLVHTYAAQFPSLRHSHVFEQNLYSLVRLAQAEQLAEIKASVRKLTGPLPMSLTKHKTTLARSKLAAFAQLALPGLEDIRR